MASQGYRFQRHRGLGAAPGAGTEGTPWAIGAHTPHPNPGDPAASACLRAKVQRDMRMGRARWIGHTWGPAPGGRCRKSTKAVRKGVA